MKISFWGDFPRLDPSNSQKSQHWMNIKAKKLLNLICRNLVRKKSYDCFNESRQNSQQLLKITMKGFEMEGKELTFIFQP